MFDGPTEDLAVLGDVGLERTFRGHKPDKATWKPASPLCNSIKNPKI